MRYLIFSTALVLISLAQTTFADGHPTISIPSESLSVKGEVTNLELTDTGRGMGIDDTGNREFAQRRGVWTREGTTLTLHSLDDLTDGTQNLCKSSLNLSSGEFAMTFYPM